VRSIVGGRLDHLESIESSATEALADSGFIKQKVDD
jgi:hypothetical protein